MFYFRKCKLFKQVEKDLLYEFERKITKPEPTEQNALDSPAFKQEFNQFDDILKDIKTSSNIKNVKYSDNRLFLNKELLEYRLNFFTAIKKIEIEINKNLTNEQLKTLKNFKQQKVLKVVECDKNIGMCLIQTDLYNKLVYDHLNNNTLYEKLTQNPLNVTIKTVKTELEILYKRKYISKRLYKKFTPKACSLGKIRLLPKLHKNKFSCRPIINCKNQATATISKFLDLLLRQITKKSKSFLRDSQNLLQKCEHLKAPKDAKLYSCDFSSLYTNIDSNKCIDLITSYTSKLLNSNELKIEGFNSLLKLVFFNNIFDFNKSYYKQLKGISMGIICGPTLANLYLMLLEESFLSIERPFEYKRYIDDIFIISTDNLSQYTFDKYFDNLELNICTSKTVEFLDLRISINKINNAIEFDLYVKKTNTFGYIKTNSNHPSKIINNVPKSLFIRIRRICSYLIDYLYHSRKLIYQLASRGFNKCDLYKTSRTFACIKRESLLPYKHKTNDFKSTNKLLMINKFDKNLVNINQLLINNWKQMDNLLMKNTQLKVIHSIDCNLKNATIFNMNIPKHYCKNYKCKTNCIACNHINTNSYSINKYLNMPILEHGTCTSKGIIYCLYCVKCNIYYIGESSRTLRERLSEHLNKIKNYALFKDKPNETEVSLHFSSTKHSIKDDLRINVLRKNISDNYIRKNMEMDLLNVLLAMDVKIINERKIFEINNLNDDTNNFKLKHLFFS
jgi:predicted GIY-YIG superfamily endonuclease